MAYAASDSRGQDQLTLQGSRDVRDLVLKPRVHLPTTVLDPGKVGLSAHERFFLGFFRNVGAFDFASYPYNIFLSEVVGQLGESQPSVKHAALALTALGHTRARCYFGEGNQNQLNDFVLRQTGKSLTHLLRQPAPKDLLNGRAQREVTMTMCGILALLADLQSDFDAQRMHLMYGQRAMQEWQDTDFDGGSIAPTLAALFATENRSVQLLSNPASFLQDDNPFLLQASSYLGDFNISTAKSTVARHFDWWSSFVLNRELPNGFQTLDDNPHNIFKNSHVAFLFKVRIYRQQLNTSIEQAGFSAPQSVLDLLTALRLWEQTTCAMVAAALVNYESSIFKPSQMGYDAVWAYFRRINEFGKKILQSLVRQNASVPDFPIGPTVGTPLFCCGCYCRDWSIRREALRLLKALEERFKGSGAAAFLPMKISALERIIDIESHGLQPGGVVPESARIQSVRFTGRPGSSSICFSYQPVGVDGFVEVV